MTCRRCDGDHPGLACKITFRRAWKGRAKTQILVVSPLGREIKIEANLSQAHMARLLDLMVEIDEASFSGPTASGAAPKAPA